MRKVRFDEVLGLGDYETIRPRFRARMIEHKRRRRLLVGPEMSVLFEDHDSMLMQVQEMLRAERITSRDGIEAEIAVYNELVPPDGALLATLMIEINDPALRDARRAELFGIEEHIALELGDLRVAGTFAPEGLQPGRIAVVQYVTFVMTSDTQLALSDTTRPARFACTHPRYNYTVDIPTDARVALSADLDPRNAEAPA